MPLLPFVSCFASVRGPRYFYMGERRNQRAAALVRRVDVLV